MNTGDQITRVFIRSVKCPVHGEFCHIVGPVWFCRARINKAINQWHNNRIKRREDKEVWK